MKREELDKGKKLADAARKWWRSSVPAHALDDYNLEPIPQFMKWWAQVGVTELEKNVQITEDAESKRKRARKK